jgi:branched-subunit amino acid transport protein AzlD
VAFLFVKHRMWLVSFYRAMVLSTCAGTELAFETATPSIKKTDEGLPVTVIAAVIIHCLRGTQIKDPTSRHSVRLCHSFCV